MTWLPDLRGHDPGLRVGELTRVFPHVAEEEVIDLVVQDPFQLGKGTGRYERGVVEQLEGGLAHGHRATVARLVVA